MTLIHRATSVHIGNCLLQSLGYDSLHVAPSDFQLQHDALNRSAVTVGQWLADKQVGAAASQPILTVDIPASVDHTLQERLQQQLRTRLGIEECAYPRVRVLTEELLEIQKQLLKLMLLSGLIYHCAC